jgi:hypothetical protein
MKHCDDCGKEVGTLYRLKETKHKYINQVCFHCYTCLNDPFYEQASEFLPEPHTLFSCMRCDQDFPYRVMMGTEDPEYWLVCLDCLPRFVEIV